MQGLTFTPVSATSLADAVSAAPQATAGGDFSSFRQVHDQETSRMNDYSAFDGSSGWSTPNPVNGVDMSTAGSGAGAANDPRPSDSQNSQSTQSTPNTQSTQSAANSSDTARSKQDQDSDNDSRSSDDNQASSSAQGANQSHQSTKTDKTDAHHKTAKDKGDKKHDSKGGNQADASAVAASSQPGKQTATTLSLNIAVNAQAAKSAAGSKGGDSASKGDAAKNGQSIAADLKVGDGNGDGKKASGKSELSNLLKTVSSDGKVGNAKSASTQTSRFFQQLQASGGGQLSTTGDSSTSAQSSLGAQQAGGASGTQAAAGAKATANATPLNQYTTSVNVPVGQAAWGDQIAGKIAWLTHQGMHMADIHLNPADLGPIQVQVQMHNDQANIVMHTHHAGVRDLLEANGGKLRDMLQNNGVGLGSLNVSTQSGQQQNGQQPNDSGSGSGSRGLSTGGITSVSGAEVESGISGTVQLAWRGEVDLYA